MTDEEVINDLLSAIDKMQHAIRDLQQSMPMRAVQLLRPQPGDVVLVSIPDNTREDQRRALGRSWHEACGPKVRIAVLPNTFAVRVIRVEDIPPDAFCGPPSLDMGTQILKPGESSML